MEFIFENKQGNLRSGWKVIVYFIVSQAFLAILGFFIILILESRRINSMHVMVEIGPTLGAIVGLGVSFLALDIEKRPFCSLGIFITRRWLQEFSLGIISGAVIIVVIAVLLWIFGAHYWVFNPKVSTINIGIGIFYFTTVGFNEEITFRGYPFQRLVENIGIWPAQIIMAIPFVAIHLGNPGISIAGPSLKAITLINLFLSAILFALCYIQTCSLALPIGLHIGWNWVQGNLLGFNVSGTTLARGFLVPVMQTKSKWMTGGEVGLEGSLICTLVSTIAILILVLWKPLLKFDSQQP